MNTTETTTAPVNPDSHNTMTTLPTTEQRQLASDTRQTDDSQKTAATTVSPAMTGMGCHLLDKRIGKLSIKSLIDSAFVGYWLSV